MTHILGLLALTFGIMAGLRFPDIDQSVGFLLHRSAITHGPLLPLLIFAAAAIGGRSVLRWFATGLSVGFAVHLSFDLFPRAWLGYALISVPVYGWLPAIISWLWIAVSALICLYLGSRLTSEFWGRVLLHISIIAAFGYAALDEAAFWRPLAAMIVITILAGILAGRGQKHSEFSET